MQITCAPLFQKLNMGGGEGFDAGATGRDYGKFHNSAT